VSRQRRSPGGTNQRREGLTRLREEVEAEQLEALGPDGRPRWVDTAPPPRASSDDDDDDAMGVSEGALAAVGGSDLDDDESGDGAVKAKQARVPPAGAVELRKSQSPPHAGGAVLVVAHVSESAPHEDAVGRPLDQLEELLPGFHLADVGSGKPPNNHHRRHHTDRGAVGVDGGATQVGDDVDDDGEAEDGPLRRPTAAPTAAVAAADFAVVLTGIVDAVERYTRPRPAPASPGASSPAPSSSWAPRGVSWR
jgi:hypothetical protein